MRPVACPPVRTASPPSVVRSAGVAAVVAAGVAFRFWAQSDLWLDEALTVNIASLPPDEIFDALRRDGHPPLHYLLLHYWMEVFGDGDTAVRALSGVFSVAALPLAWMAGRRLGGRRLGALFLVLLATSPFAVRYATEARMYSLVTLLALGGWLLLHRALERPTAARLVPVALVSGLLLLTHYWAFHLLVATAALLAWRAWRGTGDSAAAVRSLVALAAGGVLFLPWLGGFLHQARHTGTPWGRPERPPQVVMVTLEEFGGGIAGEARFLGLLLAVLVLLGALGRAVDRRRVELDLAGRPEARAELAVVVGTLSLGVAAGWLTASTYAARYASIVLPFVLLLAALGLTRLLSPRIRIGVLVVVVALGFVGSGRNATTSRTQGGDIGRELAASADPGDVVGVCPDQLAPAVVRHIDLDRRLTIRPFPFGGSARFVDWVDYGERMDAGDPAAYAAQLLGIADGGDVWLVWSGGYRTLEDSCEEVHAALAAVRPAEPVVELGTEFEHAWLIRYAAP